MSNLRFLKIGFNEPKRTKSQTMKAFKFKDIFNCKSVSKVVLIYFLTHFQILFCFSQVNQKTTLLYGFNRGEYNVGYQSINAIDYSRSFENIQGRQLSIMVWYPAESKNKERILFQDYLKQSKTDSSSWATYFKQFSSDVRYEKLLNSSFLAKKNVSIGKGEIPIIIYSPGGYGDEFENYILCELLASHGYIVAAHESKGPTSKDTKITSLGLLSQARDIEYTIQKVQETFPQSDVNNVGLIGWSWGGLASTVVQIRNPNIDAVVSLDGSISLHEDKLKSTPYYSLQDINVPYLFVSASKTSNELNPFISKLKYSESLFIEYPFLEHGDFNSLVFNAYHFTDEQSDKMVKNISSYRYLTSTVIAFLNKSMIRNEQAQLSTLLSVQKEGNLIEYREIKSLPAPPSTDDFFQLFQTNSKEEIQNIFEETYKRDSTYIFFQPEEAINYAYALHYDFDLSQRAIQLLTISTILFPNNYSTYGHLGNLYSKNGELPEALENFSKAHAMVSNDQMSSAAKQDFDWYTRSIERIKTKLKK